MAGDNDPWDFDDLGRRGDYGPQSFDEEMAIQRKLAMQRSSSPETGAEPVDPAKGTTAAGAELGAEKLSRAVEGSPERIVADAAAATLDAPVAQTPEVAAATSKQAVMAEVEETIRANAQEPRSGAVEPNLPPSESTERDPVQDESRKTSPQLVTKEEPSLDGGTVAEGGREVPDLHPPGEAGKTALEAELWQTALHDRLRTNFEIVGASYYYRDHVAFVDLDKSLQTFDASARTVQGVVDAAQLKGWKRLQVDGSQLFQRRVWIEATARGLHVLGRGYEPTDDDRRQAAEQAATRIVPEPTQDRRAPNLRTEPNIEQASTKPETLDSRLVGFGYAPYRFQAKADQSFYVKVERDGKEHVTWGKDLERAIGRADAQPGDRIRLERTGADAVEVKAARTDERGQTKRVAIAAERGNWTVEVTHRQPREVAQTPAQAVVEKVARAAGATQTQVDQVLRVARGHEAEFERVGQTLDVRGIDPAAPRQQPIATVRPQERAAPTRDR